MRRPLVKAFLLSSALAATGALSACASSPPRPTGPVELDGTKWKLVVIGGRMDGRVVEFKKVGEKGYKGTLVELGPRLRNATGVEVGREIFIIKMTKENTYEGVYKAVSPDGAVQDKELILTVDGNNLNWNQESAVWERVYE